MRCLLIDDRVEEHKIFENALELTGLPVWCIYETNAKKAIEKLSITSDESLPQIIFLDIYMPGMDGKLFIKQIKADARLASIPIYVYSSSTEDADINQLIKSGAAFYIRKTSNIAGLSMALKVLLGRMQNL